MTKSLVNHGATNGNIRTHVHELFHLSSDTDDDQNYANRKLSKWPNYADFWEVVASAGEKDRFILDLNFSVNSWYGRN